MSAARRPDPDGGGLGDRRRSILAWTVAALAAGVFLWLVVRPIPARNTYGFSVYYTSAVLVLEGRAGVGLYGDALRDAQNRLGLVADSFGPFPPTMALAMVPIAWLPARGARVVWVALDVGLVAAIAAVAARLGGRSGPLFAPLAVILVTLFQPFRAEIEAGQVYVLLAFLYALWLAAFMARRDGVCGAALAALALLKLSGWPLWVLAAVRGRLRILAFAAACAGGAALVTLPVFGVRAWEAFILRQVPGLADNPAHAALAYQTLWSLLRQTLVLDSTWSPAPLMHAPLLAGLLWTASAAIVLWLTLRDGATPGELPTALATCCLIVPLQPAGEDHHYVVLLVVLFWLLHARARLLERRAALALAGLAVILLAVPPYFVHSPGLVGWPLALLGYPRVAAAMLLWMSLIVLRPRRVATSSACASG